MLVALLLNNGRFGNGHYDEDGAVSKGFKTSAVCLYLGKHTGAGDSSHLVGDLGKLAKSGELHQVQPGGVQDPWLGLWRHRIEIQGSTAFDEAVELGKLNETPLEINF